VLALAPTSHLLAVYRLLHTPIYLQTFGAGSLHAQVLLQLNLYQYGWGLVIFGIHLVLLGYLVYRSRYIPRVLGVLLALVGLIWIAIPPGLPFIQI